MARIPVACARAHSASDAVRARIQSASRQVTKSPNSRRCHPMKFELFIASRYLRAKRRQAVVGIITIISIIGVAAGVASLIIALAINNGFRQDLQDRLLGSTAHIGLERAQADGIRNWRPLLEKIQHQPHVIAASPALYEEVLVARGARA